MNQSTLFQSSNSTINPSCGTDYDRAALRPLSGHSLRRLGKLVLRTGVVTGMAPLAGREAHVLPPLAHRIGDAGTDALEAAALLVAAAASAAAVQLLARLTGAGVAEPGVDIGASRADQGVRRLGAGGRGLVEGLAGDLGLGVGSEGVLRGGSPRGICLGVELGTGIVADLDSGGVLGLLDLMSI